MKFLSKITPKIMRKFVGFAATPKLSNGNTKAYVLLLCHEFPTMRSSVLSGFTPVYSSIPMTEQRPSIIANYSARQQSHLFAKITHTADYHQHRDDKDFRVQRSHDHVEWSRG